VPVPVTTSGRQEVFEQVLRDRGKALTQLAFCLCRNKEDAQDLCAEAFASAWPRWQEGKVEDLTPYLRQVIVNMCKKAWRREAIARRYAPQLAADLVGEESSVQHRFDLIDAVLRLPPRQRAVVVLRYFEELSEQDTASLLSIATGTVKSRVSRALTTLRSSLEGESDV
jgi:RNA polymerase sigma-70 factor (sigma-E family)